LKPGNIDINIYQQKIEKRKEDYLVPDHSAKIKGGKTDYQRK
jgi:hypothetical protein